MVQTEELASRFSGWDYTVFAAMLAISAAIGLYHACSGDRQKTTAEFLMANHGMGIFPVAMSLLASFMSAITLLGTPAEIYTYGSMYLITAVAYSLTIPVAAHVYLPVFCSLELTSAYEYLEKRFNKLIRRCGSAIYVIQMVMYIAVVLYAPALALSQVTGLHVWGSVAAIGIVCAFYTTLGGMKAVMWTDVFQSLVMITAMLIVVTKGCVDAGGFQHVWNKALEGNRIQLNVIDFDPRVRHTVWSLSIGGFFMWLAIYGVNQAQVQRYLTTPTMATAQKALWWNLPGLVVLLLISTFGGLVVYAKYWDCDPLTSKLIKAPDQLFPLFVMDTLGTLPGLPGIFVAGIFSGALSSISSGINSLVAVTLEDFVKPCCTRMTEKTATLTSKLLAAFYAALCISMVAVAEQMGNVLQATISIFGIVGGPLLGIFTLGMFFPHANTLGAGIGLLVSFVITFWMGIGAQVYKPYISIHKEQVSTAGCHWEEVTQNWTSVATVLNNTSTLHINYTDSVFEPETNYEVSDFYKISYLWYSPIACAIVIIVGMLISFASGKQDPSKLDPRVISPLAKKFTYYISDIRFISKSQK